MLKEIYQADIEEVKKLIKLFQNNTNYIKIYSSWSNTFYYFKIKDIIDRTVNYDYITIRNYSKIELTSNIQSNILEFKKYFEGNELYKSSFIQKEQYDEIYEYYFKDLKVFADEDPE